MILCDNHIVVERPVICVVGPTASGKSDVAQRLAQLHSGEVISADSMQIYRGMDIGTGKVPVSERVVPHWGLDLVNPGETYSAALFQHYARTCIQEIDTRHKPVFLAGGTGLYVRATIDDYDFPSGEQDPALNEVRARYTAFLEEYGVQALWDKLNDLDPESAALIHPNNTKRVIRAFEMWELEGKRYVDQHAGFTTMKQFVPALIFELDVTPDLLAQRINRRVDGMMQAGLLDEIQSLMDAGFTGALTSREAIGYKEFINPETGALRAASEIPYAIEQVKTASRRYAKRQRTWWRNDDRVIRVSADDGDVNRIAQEIDAVLALQEW